MLQGTNKEKLWEHGNIGKKWKGTREQGPPLGAPHCLNCPASARIISSFDFKHRTSYNTFFIIFESHIFELWTEACSYELSSLSKFVICYVDFKVFINRQFFGTLTKVFLSLLLLLSLFMPEDRGVRRVRPHPSAGCRDPLFCWPKKYHQRHWADHNGRPRANRLVLSLIVLKLFLEYGLLPRRSLFCTTPIFAYQLVTFPTIFQTFCSQSQAKQSQPEPHLLISSVRSY